MFRGSGMRVMRVVKVLFTGWPGILCWPALSCALLYGGAVQAQTAPAPAPAPVSAPAAAPGTAPAQNDTAPLLRPGAWNVTPQSPSGVTLGYQLCFKTGSLDDIKLLMPNIQGGAGCAAPVIELPPGLVTWRFDCPAQAVQVSARYTLAPERIEGLIHITQGTPAAASSQSITAQYAGACP